MRSIHRPACAGRTDRAGHPEPVEASQQALRFAARQGKIRRVGQTMCQIPVKTHLPKALPHPGLERIAQRRHPRHLARQRGRGQFRRRAEPDDPRDILRAGTPSMLLPPTQQLRRQTQPRTHKQRTHPLRSMELVRGKRKQMHRHPREIDRHFARGLHGIRVKNDGTLVGRTRQDLDGKDDARLVVGPDHGDDRRVGTQRLQVGRMVELSAGIDRQPRHLAPLTRELLAEILRRAVFDGRRDDVPLARLRRERTAHRGVDRFGAAAGENHRFLPRTNQRRHLPARFFHRRARGPARRMRARRVAEFLAETRPHYLAHARIDRRRRVVVEIDHGVAGRSYQ